MKCFYLNLGLNSQVIFPQMKTQVTYYKNKYTQKSQLDLFVRQTTKRNGGLQKTPERRRFTYWQK